jgi:hypothetical protein
MTHKLLSFCAGTLFSAGAAAQCITPGAPTSATASPAAICSNTGGTTVLTATVPPPAGFIAWYDAPTGGNLLGVTSSTGSLSVTVPGTTIFYAEAQASGGTQTQTFSYTGGPQFWVVPQGTDSVTIEVWGAQGNSNSQGIVGGLGGYATGRMAVNVGDTLWIYVGGGGATATTGGYNGGGAGGVSPCTTADAGGGGGASDVRFGGTALANRIIVGAGGGGAGGNRIAGCGRGNGGGGGGGYFGGGGGAAWPGGTPGANPTGGTQLAGGSGGVSTYTTAAPGNNGQGGALGIGGNGGVELTSNQAGTQAAAAGGTGGGTTGNPGAYSGNFSGQSGAGGSSYFGTLVNGSTTTGIRSGNGQVVITFPNVCPSASRLPVTFVVNPLPVVTATSVPSAEICEGSQVTLSGSGAASYTWSGPTAVTDQIPFTATAASAGSYIVTGTDANNCTNTDTINIVVNPLPVLSLATADSVVCAGDTVMLTASGATTYSWSTGGNAPMEMFAAVATGYTTVTGTNTANGCSSTDSIMTTVNPLPVIVLTPSNSSICLGSSGSISASGGSMYLWNTGDSTSSINISPTVPTVYAVTVTTPDGCTGSDSVSIGVNIPPAVTATASQSVVCAGTSVTLTGAGANSWLWSSGGTQATETVTPSATTTYTVTGTNTVTNCSDTGLVTITVNQLPVVTAAIPQSSVCIDDASFLVPGGSPAGGSWTGPGVGANIFSPLSAGLGTHTLVYTYTDNNQCTASASDLLVVSACVGITENSNAGGVNIYPNPASTLVNIRWNDDYRVTRIELTDLTGRIVLAVPAATGNSLQIDLNTLPQGIYNLQVVTADGLSTHRIVKQ